MDMYKVAVRKGLRFESNRGMLTVEQLFGLPLKSKNGCDLDTIARGVNNKLKEMGEESFVEDTSSNPRKTELQVSLDIVKDVIKTIQAENAADRARLHRTAERKKLLDALEAKKDQSLSSATLEELEKKLAELDEPAA